jgi:serine phosphatase RsbU (regulator of sigma subunit)
MMDVMRRRAGATEVLLGFGLLAFLVAGLSIVDMFLPRPYDGVVLESDTPGRLTVRRVVPGSGAEKAGIRAGDRIVGIDRSILRSPTHAAKLLHEHDIGETVPYLVRRYNQVKEVEVEMGRRRIGSPAFVYACLLGFAFFFVGLFVLRRQPRLRAAQIFFLLCLLFLLFLVCRLRPASYSLFDSFILGAGTVALLFLPASFLHFFLIFPRPIPLRPDEDHPAYRSRRLVWLATLAIIYLIPPLVLLVGLQQSQWQRYELELISGAPVANWWVLAVYVLLGLAALAYNAYRLDDPKQRRGAALVLVGAVFGLIPFLVTAVAFPSFLHTEKFLFYGVAPLILVPLTFAFAIARFQLLDIRIILQKSLLYTITTAVVTGLYALGITLFNYVAKDTELADSPFFPIIFALVIVLLFEPVRRSIQVWVDRFFFAERGRLEMAIRGLSQAVTAQVDLGGVVRDLVEQLPRVLGLHFAGLYLVRESRLEREAGPESLPGVLPLLSELHEPGAWLSRLIPLDSLSDADAESRERRRLTDQLRAAGVEAIGELASPRRPIGIIVLSGKVGQMPLDSTEIELLDSLLHQVAMTLETSLLLEERTQQAELERELEIAASVQSDLLPATVSFAEGWTVAAVCRPARHVGGDFFTELPGPRPDTHAMVYGDVAGKSVSGALVMMAAHEALHALAMSHKDPETLFDLANQRLYRLGHKKSFVALAYLTVSEDLQGIDYLLAGQPQPLIRRRNGTVSELPLPDHRLPLGALINGGYKTCHTPVRRGDLVLGYSDGVVDALSPQGASFGIERLSEVVAAAPPQPEAVIDLVVQALKEFTEGTEPYDDVTLVAIACDREGV